ncbi:MAG TPA: TMEM165/GDT1 family protein, partial [Bacillota bacterium]|nr:TMEM165/GDT1 family protein [Bacillota bacterium]
MVKLALSTFAVVFLAELGDKTQLATMVLSAKCDPASRWGVLIGAAAALVTTSVIGVLAGAVVGRLVPENVLKYVAGAAMIIMGALLMWG